MEVGRGHCLTFQSSWSRAADQKVSRTHILQEGVDLRHVDFGHERP